MNPVVVGLGLQTAGSVAKSFGNRAAEDARRDALNDELARQAAYQDQIDQSLGATMAQFTNPQADYRRNAKRRAAYITSGIQDDGTGLPMSGGTPDSVRKDLSQRLTDALKEGRTQAAAQARVGGAGAQTREYFDALRESGNRINTIRNFARGSSRLLPMEMELANMKAQPYYNFADLLSGGGSMVSAYGMMRPPTEEG